MSCALVVHLPALPSPCPSLHLTYESLMTDSSLAYMSVHRFFVKCALSAFLQLPHAE